MSSSDFVDRYRLRIKQTTTAIDDSISTLAQKISNSKEKLHTLSSKNFDDCIGASSGSLKSSRSLYPCLSNVSPESHRNITGDITSYLLLLRRRMDLLSSTLLSIGTTSERDYIQIKEDQEKIKAVAWKISALQNLSSTNQMLSREISRSTSLFQSNSRNNYTHNNVSNSLTLSMSPSICINGETTAAAIDDDHHTLIPTPAPKPNKLADDNWENNSTISNRLGHGVRNQKNSDSFTRSRVVMSELIGECPRGRGGPTERDWGSSEGLYEGLLGHSGEDRAINFLSQPSSRHKLETSAVQDSSLLENLGLSEGTMELLENNEEGNENRQLYFRKPTSSVLSLSGPQSKELARELYSGSKKIVMSDIQDLATLENLGLSEETMVLLGYKIDDHKK